MTNTNDNINGTAPTQAAKTYFVGRTSGGNIAVEDSSGTKSCLVTSGSEAGKWLDGDANFPGHVATLKIEAGNAREAAEKYLAQLAREAGEKAEREAAALREINARFGGVLGLINAHQAAKRAHDRMAGELHEFKNSPTKLRAALKRAEARAAKAKASAALARKAARALAKLPATPAKPMKGRGHDRFDFAGALVGDNATIWSLIPDAHKTTVAYRSGAGYFGHARAISAEAAVALEKFLA